LALNEHHQNSAKLIAKLSLCFEKVPHWLCCCFIYLFKKNWTEILTVNNGGVSRLFDRYG